jgi:3-mercaptopyruvate sulfurtransferase SseA
MPVPPLAPSRGANRRTQRPLLRLALGLLVTLAPLWAWAQALVDPAWLMARRAEPGLVLLDASPMPIHRAGHIPGAVNADLMFGGTAAPSAEQMRSRFRAWGLHADSRIVVYDNQDTMWATRVIFDLYRHGVPLERLHLLDGGLKAWQAAGGTVTKEATPTPAPGTLAAAAPRSGTAVELPEFLAATGRAAPQRPGVPAELAIVEALEPEYYFGQRSFFGRAGHVPHARMLPSADLLGPDGRFKPLPELQRIAGHLGLEPGKPVLSYCGGGVAATMPWFALRVLLGWPEVSVYVGSLREWVRDERQLPLWTWAEPQRLRSADWVAAWNPDLLRLTGTARLELIDVRPDAEYALGHVPHAASLPGDRWAEFRRDPAALRRALGTAGLNPEHEFVVIGRGGLDPAAALAWATLEALGHPKVALMLDSTDEWALRGNALAKPNAAAPRPSAGWERIAAPAGRAESRRDPGTPVQRLRVDGHAAAGGSATPGDTIALPWTEFVKPDRSLKAPHEIHARLVKAGVSRWADVRVEAEDPAEAAAALYVLRLVGWPSVALAAR